MRQHPNPDVERLIAQAVEQGFERDVRDPSALAAVERITATAAGAREQRAS
jgi:hypothetical protein